MNKLIIFVFLGVLSSGFAQTNCVTPNGEDGQCVSILDCAVLRQAVVNNGSKEFLQDSQCGYKEQPYVCCGTADDFTYNRNPKTHKNFGLLPAECGNDMSGVKIIAGTLARLDQYPWMALLEYRKIDESTGHHIRYFHHRTGFNCGGVLINDRYVLTAAYCVSDLPGVQLSSVRLGEHDLRTDPDCEDFGDEKDCTEPHQDIEVEEVIANPRYQRDGTYHSIALVRLAKPAVFKENVQPICLPLNGEHSAPGDRLTLAGWGYTPTGLMSDVKETFVVSVVDQETCSNIYQKAKTHLIKSQFCAQGNENLCKGNGGGPLVKISSSTLRYYVEGILSFGPIRCSPTWPEVYNKVSNYLIWILDNLKP